MTTKTLTRLAGALVALGLLFAALAPSAFAQFGIASFDGEVLRNSAGDPDTQAGSHPYSASNTIDFNLRPGTEKGTSTPDGNVRDLTVELPVGLIGDPSGPQCAAAGFAGGFGSSCPSNTQVGVASVTIFGGQVNKYPLYNLVPPPGVPAAFGFTVIIDPVTITASVRPASTDGTGYGLDLHLENISQGLAIEGTQVTFWGNPADPSHDAERGSCLGNTSNSSCSYDGTPHPFVTLPTSCGAPLPFHLGITSWAGGTDAASFATHGKGGEALGVDGCGLVPFAPSISTALDSGTADSPSGLAVDVTVPQYQEGLASAHIRSTTVTLPAGVSVDPSAANGLGACSLEQFGQFSEAPSSCPQNSKLGTVAIDSPLLPDALEGGIYLARQTENPFGSLLALYLVAEADGVRLKLPGKVEADPTTGRLTTTFAETPQLPFAAIKLHFFGGPSAALATPTVCGSQPVNASLTPWSGGAPVAARSSVAVGAGPNGGACASSPAARPFAPSLQAGTRSNAAASHSPFTLEVARPDGSQELGGIQTTLPKGLLATLAGVPECGAAEAAAGSCPAASQVGSVTVGAGAGSNPFFVRGGRAYLTGPYKGAPLGFDFVVPAVAGPLNLGTVNVRAAAFVDPETAQVTVRSDELPHILDGIPLRLRTVRLDFDRQGFTLNPTSCEAAAVSARVASTEGATAGLSDRFQAAGCGELAFGPKVTPKILGGRKGANRLRHPALQVTVKEPKGQANLAGVTFAIPGSIQLDQGNIRTACTRVQFAAGKCPAGSIYGTAVVTTPLLAKPLRGPVYLRSSSHKLPDLVIDLKGQIEIVLDGRIGSREKGIQVVFAGIPDAPISTFRLNLNGGRRGLLVNSLNLCKARARAIVKTTGQNGATQVTRPSLATSCGGRRR